MAGSAATMVTRPVSGFWRYYCLQLDRRPLLTRCITGLVGGALGDAAAQMSERAATRRHRRHASVEAAVLAGAKHRGRATQGKAMPGAVELGSGYGAVGPLEELADDYDEQAYDWVRTVRLALWGALVGAPLGYKWYQLLDGRVCVANPTSPHAVVIKTLLDQLIMAPFGTALFFVGMKTLEGSPHLALPTLFEKYPTAMAANYTLWPLAHVINFAFVPASQRILYVNAVAVGWTAVLSHLVQGHKGDVGSHHQQLKVA